jgi:ubiquinone/menaquinone biosynthesis C-methylase UbiE
LAHYQGPAVCHVGDCRALPFADHSKDIVIVQGGLHHLPDPHADLHATVAESHRVLRNDGRLAIVEPWLTPFLGVVHYACRRRALRRMWPKLDALATMIDHERPTYEQWLSQPQAIRKSVAEFFDTEWQSVRFGKWSYVGRKRLP